MSEGLQHIAQAMKAAEGKTPEVLIDALASTEAEVFGEKLLPVNCGHWLVLEKLNHPLLRDEEEFGAKAMAEAFYIFTRPSFETMRAINLGLFEEKTAELMDTLPMGMVEAAMETIIMHWTKATVTAMELKAPGGGCKKKGAGSAGS